MIIYQKFIYREDLRNNPNIFYLFGDNDIRMGRGGQAKEMRGEPNAIGIRVKKAPLIGDVYYSDSEFKENTRKINEDLNEVRKQLDYGKIIVIPSDGIGTGLALLKYKAPKTLLYLVNSLLNLREV